MADLTYKVEVDTGTGVNSLQRLQQQVKTTTGAFGEFQKVLGALAIGTFVSNAYKMANSLTDMSTATGIAIQNLMGFSQAVAANGGSVDGAIDSLGRFNQFINTAAEGNKNAQSSLLQLGISLQDLATLSEQDLLRRTIEGLSNVNDNARRSALGMEIFGKSFRSVDFQGVNNGLDGFVSRAGPSADAIKAAGDAQQNFSNALTTFQVKILEALKPISELAVRISDSTSAVSRFFDIAVNAGKWALLAASLVPIVRGVMAIVGAFRLAASAATALGTGLAGLFRGLASPLTRSNLLKNLEELPGVGSKARSVMNALGLSFDFVKNNAGKLALGIGGAIGAVTEFFGLGEKTNPGIKAAEDAIAAQTRAIQENAAARERLREVTSAIDVETVALTKQVSAYQANIDQLNKKYQLETSMLSLSEKQRLLQEELQSAETAYLQAIAPLLEEYAKKKDSSNQVDIEMLPRIQEALQKVTDAYQQQIGAIEGNTAARAAANQAREFELFQLRSAQNFYDDLKRVQDEIARGPMTEIQKKYYDIMDAADASALAAIRAEEARRGAPLSTTEIDRYYETARAGAGKLYEANVKLIEQQRSFSYGWDKAFKEYADNAGNAARRAESLFKKFTQGMEDAIVNFAKTGKFEWKSFVASLAEELLRSQIQQLMAQIFNFGSSSGSSSLFGSIGDWFAGFFANGGRIESGKWGVVGEAGPELIKGPADIMPLDQVSTTGTTSDIMPSITQVTYNINAVDAPSFQALIARDPAFIHAIAMQGARSIPSTRR